MKIYNVGIVGLLRGNSFVRPFGKTFPDSRVTGVCETNRETIERVKDTLPKETIIYESYDELLDSGIDIVVLANDFHEHASFAIKALEKGIAVLSETTAAPSLGECVQLVEAVERTGGKYMLAANCLYFRGLHAMRDVLKSGKMGNILRGEAEYIHGTEVGDIQVSDIKNDLDNLHWRQTLPSCYYNMHSLGPLMYVTESMPKKVRCIPSLSPEYSAKRKKLTGSCTAMVISTMDNGAVFNTTGCANHFPTSKWYRLACEDGALETVRYDDDEQSMICAYKDQVVTTRYGWVDSGVVSKEEYDAEEVYEAGHGGIDYFTSFYFMKYMRGEMEPFFDVYRSVALSANGILAWYSALSDGKEYEIPDFTKKEDRDRVRNDFRMPFAKRYEDLTLPCNLDEKDKFEG